MKFSGIVMGKSGYDRVGSLLTEAFSGTWLGLRVSFSFTIQPPRLPSSMSSDSTNN